MTDLHTRVLRGEELRAANRLFLGALHVAPATDDEWDRSQRAYQPERTLGVFDDTLIGTARSTDAWLTVPGGQSVPLAAVTGVGVRADRTRRGVLTELVRTQFADFARRGVPAALLHATEGAIYGRFGYGVATLSRRLTVHRHQARLLPEVPGGGEIRLLEDLDAVLAELPRVYARLPRRTPGVISRSDYLWQGYHAMLRRGDGPVVAAVHHGSEGPDGFALYRVDRPALRVIDLHAATAEAFAALWRFLLGVDLVDEIHVECAPLDEPIELLVADPRACRVTAGGDETWLRLIDVPAALAARSWWGEPMVVEVTDPVLEANSGRYRLGAGPVRRCDEPAGLKLGVDALAMLYLGAWRPSALVRAGRAVVSAPDQAERADRLFATRTPPWCGTFF
jgi:predicted acetyltransferase